MQLLGMNTNPLRLSCDVTWWPESGTFGVSRRLWEMPNDGGSWQLQDMATSGSPIELVDLPNRWADSTRIAFEFFQTLVETYTDPF